MITLILRKELYLKSILIKIKKREVANITQPYDCLNHEFIRILMRGFFIDQKPHL